MSNKKIMIILSGVVLFCLSSYLAFKSIKYLTSNSQINTVNNIAATSKPKTIDAQAFCPLNGKKYSQKEQIDWEQKRPVAVMIENHPDARPQSGLSSADVVYEAVAEGGITRFMGLFLCDPSPEIVGPVRSARTYFLDWLSEYDALYAHVGGANTDGPANALGQIKTYGIKDLDQMGAGIKGGYYRDENRLGPVALEHTMYLNIEKLRQYAKATFNWGVEINNVRWDSTFEKWKYLDIANSDLSKPEASSSTQIAYGFWNGYTGFNVAWNYDSKNNQYLRNLAGSAHIDKNTNEQISVSNVILMVMEEGRADDGYHDNVHLLYQTIGKGKAYIFNNGKKIVGTWSKSGRTARTKFMNDDGQEVSLERGKIWISVVPSSNQESITVK